MTIAIVLAPGRSVSLKSAAVGCHRGSRTANARAIDIS